MIRISIAASKVLRPTRAIVTQEMIEALSKYRAYKEK